MMSGGWLFCRCGCLGVGSRTCLDVRGPRFCWLSVLFRFRKSFVSLLSFRLSLSFLASVSAVFDCSFHLAISSSLYAPLRLCRYSVTSFVIFSRVSCSLLITLV